MAEIVEIEITKPLPEKAVVDSTYKIEGSVKVADAVGAPPWVYAEVRRKEWYKPEIAEEVSYERGFPMPVSGDFDIEFKPEKEGDYQVTVVATPAPVPLPAVGVWPTVGESDAMKVAVGEKPSAVFRFSVVSINGNEVPLANKDVDSGLLIVKKTTDYLAIIPSFEWVGPRTEATISIKAGYRSAVGTFTPKTGAYTKPLALPESPAIPYTGKLEEAIKIPLTACGDISDGAIEVVAKLPGMADYISHIWNVYVTKPAVLKFRFSAVTIDGYPVPLTDRDADSGFLFEKTTAEYLEVTPAFEWRGPEKSAVISIKAGYRDWAGGFTPKTGAYTRSLVLPESPEITYSGKLEEPVRIPLTACGGLTDGAIEVVLKVADMPDYISRIWNVYATKAPPEPPEEADIKDFDFRLALGAFRIGDKVPFTAPYDYKGIAQSGQLTISIGTGLYPAFNPVYTYDPITVNFAAAADWEHRDLEGQITLPGNLQVGQTYSVRAKLETLQIRTQETDTDWSAFEIYEEAPPQPPDADIRNFDFRAVKGTYKIGEKVPFTFEYEYKGKEQRGQLVLSLGTGVWPDFYPVVTYNPMGVSFEQAMDWAPAVQISGTFTLTSALQPGQTYSARAKLETLDDPTQETDTDWSAFTVSEAPVGISFEVSIWGIPNFGSYQKWCCYYWSPAINDFVGDGKWYNSYDRITFKNIQPQPGGYLAVFLKRNSTVSPQYTSPTFDVLDGAAYQYDLELERVVKIG